MSILKNLRGRTASLNVKDLAELLNVTEGTIQRWVRRHQVPAETAWGWLAMASELNNTAKRLGREMGVEFYLKVSEDMRPNLLPASVDLCFSSPPYFAQELYSDEPTQSYKKFPNRDAWLNGFIAQTLDNCYYCLKDDGILAVNIANVSTFPDLQDAFMSLATSRRRWRHIETLQLALSPMWGTRKPSQKWKLEPIFVFSRRGKPE